MHVLEQVLVIRCFAVCVSQLTFCTMLSAPNRLGGKLCFNSVYYSPLKITDVLTLAQKPAKEKQKSTLKNVAFQKKL